MFTVYLFCFGKCLVGLLPPPYLNVALIPYANSSDSLCQCLLNLDATLTKETFSRGWQTAITQYYDVKVWENLSLCCQRSCCIIMLLPFHYQNVDRNAMELACYGRICFIADLWLLLDKLSVKYILNNKIFRIESPLQFGLLKVFSKITTLRMAKCIWAKLFMLSIKTFLNWNSLCLLFCLCLSSNLRVVPHSSHSASA